MSKVETIFNIIYRFFAFLGESVLKCPNKAFYLVIVILCILAPMLAIIMVIALLCGVYRRRALEL
ncbi:MAG: hypothetical protein FP824_06570 [Euryarchaeota archaeon]|nr:hypothetical protein [Euryarchaeota archaeon]MBU4032789.1 hypothetical protein [Candidatus Thermoplasmatota archaeon]MBU4144053.1 hypothetical protein [Candidatus Thermoplasmatota archaeon]